MKSSSSFCRFILCLFSACWAPLFGITPTRAQDASPEFWRKTAEVEGVTEYVLKNDCRVVLIPDPAASSVTVNMTVLVGSRHEGYGETGMAHLLEHMLFKGTPTHGDIDKELKDRGVLDMNGTTDYDRTNYYETLPASTENMDFAIGVEADRLQNCFIRAEDLFSEMTVVRNEFESGEDSAESILVQRIMANSYEWHNYGKTVIGNRADIERVPVNRLRAFYKKYYRPDNVVLFIAGRFDTDAALQSAANHFGSISKPVVPIEPTYTIEPTQDGERVVYLNRVGDVPMVGMGFHVPSGADPDSAALNVLQQILGDEPAGRMYQNLVKKKLASEVIAMYQPTYDPGVFGCLVKVESSATIEQAREALQKTLASIASEGVTAEEVTRAVREIMNKKEDAQTKTGQFSYLLSNWAATGDWRLFYIDRDRTELVTPADVQRVASQYFKSSNQTTGIFVPTPQPDRSTISQRPAIDGLVSGYKGRESLSQGEVFEPTPKNIAERTTRGVLKSGIKYAFLPKQVRGDRFHLKLTLRYGSEDALNSPTQLQAMEMMDDAWLHGTKKYTEEALQDKLEELKVELSASSDKGAVTFQLMGNKKFLPETLDLMGEILRNPTFPDEEFDLLKSETRSQLEASRTDPQYLAQNVISKRIAPFPRTSIHYVTDLDEQIERLQAAKASDVRELYNKFLSGKFGEVAIVGAFDKEIALTKLTVIFEGWNTSEVYSKINRPFLPTERSVKSIETPDKENAVMLGAAMIDTRSDDSDWEALYIASDILGGGSLASRLGERVREQEGLSYGVGCQFIARPTDRSGVFMLYAITNPANRNKLLKTVDEVLLDFEANGVTEAEIDSSRLSFLKQLEDGLTNDAQLASTLQQYLELNRDESFLERRRKNMEELTKTKVDSVIKKLINDRKLVIVTAGDFVGKGVK